MAWRERLRQREVTSVIDNLLECVENEEPYNYNGLYENEESEQSNQHGTGQTPENVLFNWKQIKSENFMRHHRNFRRTCHRTSFDLSHNIGQFGDLFRIEAHIDNMFAKFMEKFFEKYGDSVKYSVNISHESLQPNSIWISSFWRAQFRNSDLFNALYEVAQSNKSFLLDGKMKIEVITTECPKGNGRVMKNPQTCEETLKRSRGVIVADKEQFGCAFYSLAVCIKKHELVGHRFLKQEWKKVVGNYGKNVTKFARNIAEKCGQNFENGVSLNDFQKIQQFINYRIVVIDHYNNKNFLFVGPKEGKKEPVFLLFRKTLMDEYHYDAVIDLKMYLKNKFVCFHCFRGYDRKYHHKCEFVCEMCKESPVCEEKTLKQCNACNFVFKSETCFNNHLKNSSSICNTFKKCEKCLVNYNGDKHVCDKNLCIKCNEYYYLEKHYCYLEPKNLDELKKQDKKLKIIIAYDIESQQNKTGDGTFDHIPDLLISMTTCDNCWSYEENNVKTDDCSTCGKFKNVFHGTDCVKKFGDYLYDDIAVKTNKVETEYHLLRSQCSRL